jgi:hypothetical protein
MEKDLVDSVYVNGESNKLDIQFVGVGMACANILHLQVLQLRVDGIFGCGSHLLLCWLYNTSPTRTHRPKTKRKFLSVLAHNPTLLSHCPESWLGVFLFHCLGWTQIARSTKVLGFICTPGGLLVQQVCGINSRLFQDINMGNEQGKPISDEEVRQREIQKMDADMSRRMARGVDWNRM